jgi:hypothetical protein
VDDLLGESGHGVLAEIDGEQEFVAFDFENFVRSQRHNFVRSMYRPRLEESIQCVIRAHEATRRNNGAPRSSWKP